jgi:lysophospholipase L1-like esterase
LFLCCIHTVLVSKKKLTYLALGDSYTIGEAVPPEQNFPHQSVSILEKKGIILELPDMVAKTGWSTDELMEGIRQRNLLPQYDYVSLLIGVNNQYRGRSEHEYEKEFTELLETAIRFAGNQASHVFVLSIPDWGVTPFAEGRDRKMIGNEIDTFNAVNRKISELYGVHYIDITSGSREAAHDLTLVAEDGLHPSGKEYTKWAVKLAERISQAR